MSDVIYQRSFGQKKREAVCKFVRKVNQKFDFAERPKATFGPDGQVVVYCEFKSQSGTPEKSVRHAMAKASQQVLNSDNVWIVGIPERARASRSSATSGRK